MTPKKREPLLVVLSGPGGVGKGVLAEKLVTQDKNLALSQSWTTRTRRSDEDPEAYKFVSRQEFLDHQNQRGFIEWNEFLGELYGTPVPDASVPHDILLEIDVAGGHQIKENYSDALLIFVDAPSVEEQRRRLLERGDTGERASERIVEGERERIEAESLGYLKIINDDLKETIKKIQEVISEKRIT
tara:strand:+ start:942 stop:1502 length:561 start_codon:yes stop_codon:yes gene_type:complete